MSLGFFESAVGELPLVGRVHGGANTHLSGTRNERLLAFALFLPRERFCFVQRLCYTTFAGVVLWYNYRPGANPDLFRNDAPYLTIPGQVSRGSRRCKTFVGADLSNTKGTGTKRSITPAKSVQAQFTPSCFASSVFESF